MTPSQQVAKAICLAQLARRFEAGETVTARHVAEEYGVSLRNSQRWLNDISSYLVPLVYEEGKWRRFVA